MARPVGDYEVKVKLRSEVVITEEYEYNENGQVAKKTTKTVDAAVRPEAALADEMLLFSEWLDANGYMRDDAHPKKTHEDIVTDYLNRKD